VATRELRTLREPVFCEVCRRSLLRGESPVTFRDGRTVREVCDLCTMRAERQGWVRDGAELPSSPAAHAERARSLVGRLRARLDEAPTDAPRSETDASEPRDDIPRHVQAVPTDAQVQSSHALGLFNASQFARDVAGVVRSLGAPYVHVGPSDSDGLLDVLIVWELCWYRYEVDLENGVVRLRTRGYEPAELGGDLSAANAIADERGKLTLARH
jgi:hypothetical protein